MSADHPTERDVEGLAAVATREGWYEPEDFPGSFHARYGTAVLTRAIREADRKRPTYLPSRRHANGIDAGVDLLAPPAPTLADRIRTGALFTEAVKALPPPEPLVAGYFNMDSLALLYGASGLGKTFLAVDIARHVSAGAWWQGREVKGGGTLYVVAEGAHGIGQRLEAWESHNRITAEVHPMRWLPWAVNIADAKWTEALAEVVADWKPALIVIDTFNRNAIGVEENSARDVGKVIGHLDLIRTAAGSCVLVVHHIGKDGAAGARGSSALRAAMDSELELTGDSARLVLKVTKQKDGPELPPLRLGLVPVDGTASCAITSAGNIDPDDLPAGVASTLEALMAVDVPGGVPATAWRVAADAPERTFYRHRSGLMAKGLVVNVGSEAQPRYRPAETDSEQGEHL